MRRGLSSFLLAAGLALAAMALAHEFRPGLLERAFRALEIHWPRPIAALPGYAVGSLGAHWTIQRTLVLLGGGR